MRLIPKKETLTIEFKSDIDCLDEKELVSEIVGMTNTEGGVLYLGVEDNGEITGVHKKHKDPNGAMALIANKTVPSLSVRAEIIEEEGREVLQIQIPIAKMYNDSETYYAPVIYLSVEGEPVIFDGIFPLITNPLELNYYLGNWEKAGITIENYEVNIIKEDSDFILKILSLISNEIRPIVDMVIGKDRRLIKGCVIHTMRELEEMHY